MKTIRLFPITLFVSLVLLPFTDGFAGNDNWTHFRGNDLSSVAPAGVYPAVWDENTNIKWEKEIYGRGWSSPVIYGDQIWITTASVDGKRLYAVCVDFNTGEEIFNKLLFDFDEAIRKHNVNSYASPTSAIEDGKIYIHFGRMGTVCLDTKDASVIWKRTDLECDHVQGPGSSVVIYKDLIILTYDGVDKRFIVALNKNNGETVWETHRQEEPYTQIPWIGTKAYITPLLVNAGGRDIFVSNGSAIINGYDAQTGEELWSIVRGAESTVAMPFKENGVVYFETGFMIDEDRNRFSELIAVNPDGRGDIAETNVLWTRRIASMPLATPVIKDGLIYTVDSQRVMQCIDAETGEEVWSNRLRSQFNSSPVYAGNRIYFSSTRGETIVIEPGRELKIVAENEMPGEIWATPAFVRNSIIMRTDTHLYRIAE